VKKSLLKKNICGNVVTFCVLYYSHFHEAVDHNILNCVFCTSF